jgi:hypothetical protein
LEVKKQDEGLRKRDLEVKERKQQQQVLKRSQRALKESVSHIITVGLKDISKPYAPNTFQRDDVSSP